MRAKIVRIGNSRGVRLPKALLDQCRFEEDVEIETRGGAIVIRPVQAPRAGWEEAFKEMAKRGEDLLLDEETPTRFDEGEWKW